MYASNINNNIYSHDPAWMKTDFNKNLVSVIVPSYNREKIILDTLNSVLFQTYRPIELIMVDDGSTDKTYATVLDWKNKNNSSDFTIQIYRQKNAGACVARNHGLIKCKGEFIQFLDSDDILTPNKIENQLNALRKSKSKISAYGVWIPFYVTHLGIQVKKPPYVDVVDNPLKLWLSGFNNWFIAPHAFLWFRQDIITMGPWDSSLSSDQDLDFALNFILSGGSLVFCPNSPVFYRLHKKDKDSISSNHSKSSFYSRFRVLNRIEEKLIKSSNIAEYSNAISSRYMHLARRTAFSFIDLSILYFANYLKYAHYKNFLSIMIAYLMLILCQRFFKRIIDKLISLFEKTLLLKGKDKVFKVDRITDLIKNKSLLNDVHERQ